MEFNFAENADFKDILRRKQQEIMTRSISGRSQETDKFKKFHAALVSYLKESARIEFKLLLIEYDHIEKLSDYYYEDLKNLLDLDDIVYYNYIVLNNKLEIVDKVTDDKYSQTNDALKLYAELSKHYAVFLLQPQNKVSYFLNGESYVDGIFVTHEDYISYEEKNQ